MERTLEALPSTADSIPQVLTREHAQGAKGESPPATARLTASVPDGVVQRTASVGTLEVS